MNLKVFNLFESLDENFDGILLSGLKLLRYYTNLDLSAGVLFVTRTDAFLFVDFRYFEIAKKKVKNCEVVLYGDLKAELNKVLTSRSCLRVAVASEGLFVKNFFDYRKYFSDVEFVLSFELDSLIARQKAIKSKHEIAKIEVAQQVTDWVFSEVLNFIKPGISEIEIARQINSLICKKADGIAFETIVVSGTRTSLPHGKPSCKLIEHGDFITMDFGAVIDGYCSDMTRTVCVKWSSNFNKEIYEIVLSAQNMALNSLKVGVECKYVDSLVRDYFGKFGYKKEFGHSLGHGVGLNCHEWPFLSSNSLQTIENGVVVTVEPGLYFENRFGVRIEDLVLVTLDGVVNFTTSEKSLIFL